MLFNTYMAHLKANLSPSAYELKVKGNHIQEGIKLGYYVVVSGEPLWNSNLHHKIVNMADIKEVEDVIEFVARNEQQNMTVTTNPTSHCFQQDPI